MDNFIDKLNESPKNITFEDTLSIIDKNYNFKETEFKNGDIVNKKGENNGSCKLFSFAKLQNLSEKETLNCFGEYYQNDVLANSDGDNHKNIRNFMQTGWQGIEFKNQALTLINID